MMRALAAKYDIFLSYSHKDEAIAKWLNGELQARGVRTFLDQKSIDPGALFEQNIFAELAQCKSYGLILTSNSLKSDWVIREYACAYRLLEQERMRIIPLRFEAVDVPSNLALHNMLDFCNEDRRTASLNSLVFPGITGKPVHIWLVNYDSSRGWQFIKEYLSSRHGVFDLTSEDVVREWMQGNLRIQPRAHSRIIAVVDFFGRQTGIDPEWRIEQSARFLFDIRERTRGTDNEVVFILFFHDPAVMKQFQPVLEEAVGDSKIKRLRNYFQIDLTQRDDKLQRFPVIVVHSPNV